VLKGRDQIVRYIGNQVSGNAHFPSPFPGHSHHIVTSKLIKVDGNTATLTAAWLGIGTNDTTGAISINIAGEYLTDFKRTGEGWKISHNRPIVDRRGVTGTCDLNGPIPR
jgi:hypothetical protein